MNLENIKIENKNGKMVVSSREVAENFEKQHKHVLEKINDLIEEMNSAEKSVQYFIPSDYKDSTGKSNKEYLITEKGFSLLVMGFNGKKALKWKMKYIEAFDKMKEYIEQQPKAVPTNFKEALQQLLLEVEEKEKLQDTVKQLQPKAEFAEAIVSNEKSIDVGSMAKILYQNGINVGRNRLFDWLRNNNYLIKNGERKNMPTQLAMEKELFEIKERTVSDPNGVTRITRTTKVTGKGQVYFINKFLKGEA